MMFGFASLADLSLYIRANLHRIPSSVDLIVGIPRSGMVPAYLMGAYVNRYVVDLEVFLKNGSLVHGFTRSVGASLNEPMSAKHILLVDDSVGSGNSMNQAVARIAETSFSGKISKCSIFAVPSAVKDVDIFFKEMPYPHVFEWNAFHDDFIEKACFDLDGVLCVNPTESDDDDGSRYQKFLINAQPLIRPSYRIGSIVSARLEKYRGLTEEWLRKNEISYGALHLVDLPTHKERVAKKANLTHKANVYRSSSALLFYESEADEAYEIAKLSGKPVLCVENMQLFLPGVFDSPRTFARYSSYEIKRPLGHLRSFIKRLLPRRVKNWLKKKISRLSMW